MSDTYLITGIAVATIGIIAYSVIRHGSWKGALFGAKVRGAVGHVSGSGRGIVSKKLKVYALGDPSSGESSVGIEFTRRTPGSWNTTPLRLSGSEVRKLIRLLEQAMDGGPIASVDPSA